MEEKKELDLTIFLAITFCAFLSASAHEQLTTNPRALTSSNADKNTFLFLIESQKEGTQLSLFLSIL